MATETLLYEYRSKGLDDLRDETQKLAEDFEDAGGEAAQAGRRIESAMEEGEDAARDLDNRLNDIDARGALASMQRLSGALDDIDRKLDRLDGRTLDVDTDVDRARGTAVSGGDGSRGARLPGELDEVAEAGSFLASLSPQTQAFLGALTAATAALGTAGGLAGVATKLAAELGDQGIQRDLNELQRRLKGTGNVFASEFEPVIRNQVIPAADALAKAARDSADDLAAFTGGVLGFFGAGEDEGGGTTAFGGAMGMTDRARRRALDMGQQPEITAGTGGPPALENADRKVQKFRMQLLRAAKAQDLLREAGRSQEKALQKQISTYQSVIQKAAKFGGKLDTQSLAYQRVQKFIQDVTSDLQRLEGQLASMNFAERVGKLQRRVQSQIGRPAREAEAAGTEKVPTGGVPTPTTKDLAKMGQYLKQVKKTKTQLGLSAKQANRLSQSLKVQTARAFAQSFVQIGRAIGGAENAAKAMKRTVVQLITRMGTMLAVRGLLTGNLAALGIGAGLAIGGGALQSLDSGGITKKDTVAQLHAGEAVAPLGELRSMISSAQMEGMRAALKGMRQPTATATQPANGGASAGVSAGKARLDGDEIRIPIRMIGVGNRKHSQHQTQLGRR